MIKYNWEVLRKYSKDDIKKILEYFSNIYVLKGTMHDYLVNNKWAATVYNSKEPKNSYLLNIDGLILNDERGTREEQYVYLDIASKRNIFTYYNTKGKVIFVPVWKVKDFYNLNMLKTNRLLMIDSNNIYLVYEGED